MSKITLPDIASGYQLAAINQNFQKVEDALNYKVHFRSVEDGEPNSMEEDLDMDSHSVLNAGLVSTSALKVNGELIEAGNAVSVATMIPFEFVATSGQTQFSISPYTNTKAAILVFINGVQQATSVYSISGSTVTLPSQTVGNKVNILVFDRNVEGMPYTSSDLVSYDGETLQTVSDGAKTLAGYTSLRSYSGRASSVRLTASGVAGQFEKDLTDTTSIDDGGIVIVDALSRRWKRTIPKDVNVLWYGAVGDGVTDNTLAFTSAIAYCMANKKSLFVPGGRYIINGGQLVISNALEMYGEGRDRTVLVFKGSPTKSQVTRVVWRAEYDTGVYTSNSDAAVAAGIRVTSQNVSLHDFTLTTDHDPNVNYTTPFNSATMFPTSNYEYGLLVQAALVSLENLNSVGVWPKAGLCIDGSNVGGIGDGFDADDCTFAGMYGVMIQGPQGQFVSGDNYLDMNSSDTRCAAGMSDISFNNCKIYDTSGILRLYIDGVRKLVRRSATGGALYINGQVALNSAKRIQGIHFNNCRLSATDRYILFINYANRVRFVNCHSEYRAGSYNTDGVTAIAASDCELRTTSNSRKLMFIGGEKSGESDNRTFKDSTTNIIDEFGYDVGTPRLRINTLATRGTFTPTVTGSTSGTALGSFDGYYSRVGNHVMGQIRCALTAKNGITGNILFGNLPFVATNSYGSGVDWVCPVLTSNVTVGAEGLVGLINNNTNYIQLQKVRSGATTLTVTEADLIDTSLIIINFAYDTEDA